MKGALGHSWTLRLAVSSLVVAATLMLPGCSGGENVPDELANFKAATDAIAAGDKAEGMRLLTECIEAKPTHYAYLERAKLYVAENKITEARADVNAGLALDPAHRELLYYAAELEKPEGQRFKVPMSALPESRK